MIIEMIINDNCDDHHLLIMVGAQSAEDNHDYLDGFDGSSKTIIVKKMMIIMRSL